MRVFTITLISCSIHFGLRGPAAVHSPITHSSLQVIVPRLIIRGWVMVVVIFVSGSVDVVDFCVVGWVIVLYGWACACGG